MTDSDRSVAGRVDVFESIHGETIIRIQSSLPSDHPYYPLIGRVASEWTHFEHILDEIIRDISQIMGATTQFKIIDALGKHVGLPEPLLKKARQLKQAQYTETRCLY